MKRSKMKEVVLIKNKMYVYIAPDEIYIRIDKVRKDDKAKIHKIKKLIIIQYIRNLFKKIPIQKTKCKIIKFKKVNLNKRSKNKKQ